MNKDFNLKNELSLHSKKLRQRISQQIKQIRDFTEEVSPDAFSKQVSLIPVTGGINKDKYYNNKSRKFLE